MAAAMRRTTGSESGLAGPSLHIVLALGTESKHGYAIMQDIDQRSRGQIRILPGTLYSTIKKLVSEGLVEECDAPASVSSDDGRRRYYRVTKTGRAAVRAQTDRMALLVKLGKVFG
jgi:DNA-binding PadR family transcriptional regulator